MQEKKLQKKTLKLKDKGKFKKKKNRSSVNWKILSNIYLHGNQLAILLTLAICSHTTLQLAILKQMIWNGQIDG